MCLRFAGDPRTRIGSGVLWCAACREGVRICRAKAPEGVPVDDPDRTFEEVSEVRFVEPE